mmetsp:Transcript_3964/g.9564  ORF Transcript_3964/g.9564 Transcript_3964/m.9564 type:complete len:297 (-) Transcript_3964:191-1081(-)
MHEHVFDSLLEGDAGTGTPDARPRQLHRHDPGFFLEITVVNVSSVFLDGGPDSILDEFLDHRHNLVVVFQNGGVGDLGFVQQHLVVGVFEEIHQRAKDFRPHELPLGLGSFRDGDEITSKVDRLHAVDLEQVLGQRRLEDFFDRVCFVQKMPRPVFVVQNDRIGRKKLYRFRIRCVFGLNEYGSDLARPAVSVLERILVPKMLRRRESGSWLRFSKSMLLVLVLVILMGCRSFLSREVMESATSSGGRGCFRSWFPSCPRQRARWRRRRRTRSSSCFRGYHSGIPPPNEKLTATCR